MAVTDVARGGVKKRTDVAAARSTVIPQTGSMAVVGAEPS